MGMKKEVKEEEERDRGRKREDRQSKSLNEPIITICKLTEVCDD